MAREAREAPDAVRAQLAGNRDAVAHLAGILREFRPRAVVTCARGSSDHAATFAKYLIETRTGLLTSSAAPSTASVYGSKAELRSVLFLAISQSGASPDLLAAAAAARNSGALVVAIVNAEGSPLARVAQHCLPLRAGTETSVAATKSYIAALAAIVHLVAVWTGDRDLQEALAALPDALARARDLDWDAAIEPLQAASSLYVVSRGLGLGIAQEAALKFKETCGLHAEAFSAAELKHGPMALVEDGFPVMIFAQHDETHAGLLGLAAELGRMGAKVLLAGGSAPGAATLPAERSDSAIEPILMIQSFYPLANALAIARGRNPDQPPHLHKVTETL
ncbi:MAG TPA: SIS domain-containing protein [Steroidobacteraceae bacterium]|nr:SIS domain-containing protein [Steroidobacteraceae bacterium]